MENLLTKLTPGGLAIENINDTSKTPRKTKKQGGRHEHSSTATRSSKQPAISASEVAAGLAGLPERTYYFALAKYTEDPLATKTFIALFTTWVGGVYKLDEKQAKALALLACEGHIWHQHCNKCEGRKIVYNRQQKPRDCEACGGSGKKRVSDVKAGEMMGVSNVAFAKSWSNRVSTLQSVLTDYIDKASTHLWHQFKDSKD